jgi:hypothetical protein
VRRGACQVLQYNSDWIRVSSVKHDEMLSIRVPGGLRGALERERRRMSEAAGAEVKTSAAVRAILEKQLRPSDRARRPKTVAVR